MSLRRSLTLWSLRALPWFAGLGLLAAATVSVFTSEAAPQLLAERLPDWVPGLRLSAPKGRLSSGLQLLQLEYRNGELLLQIDQLYLDAGLTCQHSLLCLQQLSAERVHLALPASPPVNDDRAPLALPPLFFGIDRLALQTLEIVQGESRHQIDAIAASLQLSGRQLQLSQFSATLPPPLGRLSMHGQLPLQPQGPLALQARLEDQQLDVTLQGDLPRLNWQAEQQAPPQLTGKGQLRLDDQTLQAELQLGSPWTLPTAAITLRQAQLHAEGTLVQLKISGAAELQLQQASNTPPLHAQLEAEWQTPRLALQSLTLDAEGLQARIQAELLTEPSLSANGSLSLAQFKPEAWGLPVAGQLKGQLAFALEQQLQQWHYAVPMARLEGRWQQHPLLASLQLEGDTQSTRIQQLELSVGRNLLNATAALGEQVELQGTVQAPELQQLWPGLGGRLNGRFGASGPLANPTLAVQLDAPLLSLDELALEQLTLLAQGKPSDGRIEILSQHMRLGEQQFSAISAKLSGGWLQHRLQLHGSSDQARLALTLDGRAQGQDWQGLLRQATLTPAHATLPAWQLKREATLGWQAGAGPHLRNACWQANPAELCVNLQSQAGAGQAQAQLRRLPLQWLDVLALDARLRGELGLEGSARWAADGLQEAQLTARLQAGTVQTSPDTPVLPIRQLEGTLGLLPDRARLRLTLDGGPLGQLNSLGELRAPLSRARQMSLSAHLQGSQLATLSALASLPYPLAGQLDADLRLEGDPAMPQINGQLSASKLRLQRPDLGLDLRDGQLNSQWLGQRNTLNGVLHTNAGDISVRGGADWRASPWRAQLDAESRHLALAPYPGINLEAQAKISSQLSPAGAAISGDIAIPKAVAKLKELPDSAITESPDVVMADTPVASAAHTAPFPWQADLRIKLGPHVEITGYGFDTLLKGDLLAKLGHDHAPQAYGVLKLERGRYKAYGQDLKVRKGMLSFSGDFSQPRLDVEAIRKADDGTVAGLRLSGRPDHLLTRLFSEPAMPENSVLSYLITGRAPNKLQQANEAGAMQQAALSLGLASAEKPADKIAQTFGVDDFSIDTSNTAQGTQVQLSGKLSERLELRYGIGAFGASNTVGLRYQLAPRLYVDALSGVESALELIYSLEWGKRPTAAQTGDGATADHRP